MSGPVIDAELVRRLVDAQFPAWSDLPVTPVIPGGWDNRTFRLGEHLSVRLPSAAAYAPQVEKEHAWLPRIAPALPLPIPAPIALGGPGEGFPWPWSVRRWLPGAPASGNALDLAAVADDLGGFLAALARVDAAGGPVAGPHSFWRGGPLGAYDAETRAALTALGGTIDGAAALAVWAEALATAWTGPPVWVHGDVAPGNLLLAEGRLAAVIDFGCCAVGDPACDLAIAWTTFDAETRPRFRAAAGFDGGTWARGRGWALWKAAIVLARAPGANPAERSGAARTMAEILSDLQQRRGSA
jgi:aminoglycoside phosphotransferase (APT) family kinase protein